MTCVEMDEVWVGKNFNLSLIKTLQLNLILESKKKKEESYKVNSLMLKEE